jgi:protein CpxP
MLLRLIHKADLTDDQKLQLKNILASHREALRGLRSQLQANREQFIDLLLGASPVTSDDPRLKALAQQASDLRGQMAQEWLGAMVEVRNMLRPDQLTKLEGLKDQLRTLRHEMRSLLEPQP